MNATMIRTAPALVATVLAAACGDGPWEAYERPQPLPVNLGTPVPATDSGFYHPLVWSPAGNEIFYVAGYAIRAVDLENASDREVHAVHVHPHLNLGVTADGRHVFFVGREPSSHADALYYVAAEGSTAFWLGRGTDAVPIPDGTGLAYVIHEDDDHETWSLFLHDLDSRERRRLTERRGDIHRPAAFSPDGERLLMLDHCPTGWDATCQGYVMQLGTGSVGGLDLGPSHGLRTVLWLPEGIVAFRMEFNQLEVYDAGSGSSRQYPVELNPREVAFRVSGWSPDGRKVAISSQIVINWGWGSAEGKSSFPSRPGRIGPGPKTPS